MDSFINTGTNLPLSINTTVEDIIDFSKSVLQTFLRLNNLKVSGNKLELAQRVVDAIKARTCTTPTSTVSSIPTNRPTSDIPDIKDLRAGWAGKSDAYPKIGVQDVENYLIHSSHRTADEKKMECYRQYIRGLNFYKEGYIHKVMINEIGPESDHCYIRSKCYPSMKQGVYEQWILMTKSPPFHVLKASCTCPAGLGEGCTHVAGLLFALEGRPANDSDVPCTSKPCEWNKPSKRKKETKPVKAMSFKRIKHCGERDKEKKVVKYKVDSTHFRNSLCAKLGNKSGAAIFDLLPPCPNNVDVQSDFNIAQFEEVETSDHIQHISDKYIYLTNTVRDEDMTWSEFQSFLSACNQELANEIERRTRGQHSNPLWVAARAARITASNFHEIKTRKDSTKSENTVSKLLGKSKPLENAAVNWGKKQEPIAKKRYKAFMKLKNKQNVTVEEMGLVLYTNCSYIGASPDGLINCETHKYLIEVKCPYKWRQGTILDACKDKTFCCYVDEDGTVQLKKGHKYYTQVQGQMGVCQMERCDFVLYTVKDFIVIPIQFDKSFWESLLDKLKGFYMDNLFPKLKS